MSVADYFRPAQIKSIADLDTPDAVLAHAQIIGQKPFLKRLYIDFYKELLETVPEPQDKTIVELGSGAGFIKDVAPAVITSDILALPNVDKTFSAVEIPFENASVDAVVMLNVLHHIARPKAFFAEACRCLKSGGKVIMVEPANTPWAGFVYRRFHHERFDPTADWNLEEGKPLSQANGAMPWIIFCRDRGVFEREFPALRIVRIRNHTPLRYLISGGFTFRQLLPSFAYPVVKGLERVLAPMNNLLGMFQTIELQKLGQ